MEKNMETIIMRNIGTSIRIHSFIPSQPKASEEHKLKRATTGGRNNYQYHFEVHLKYHIL